MTEIAYAYQQLFGIPAHMSPWNMRLEQPAGPSQFGQYVLVGCDQAGLETHHEVEAIDEDGRPLADVWVIFGFPGGEGPQINLNPHQNYWPGAPAVLIGNAQRTSISGYVRHTFATGGEDIWIWDLDADGSLKYPSPIIKNCSWQRTPVGRFEHTGVRLRFQRRAVGIKPLRQRVAELEDALGIGQD